MEIQKQILTNLNIRYVLVKAKLGYVIVDKNRRTMVKIEDPIINFEQLIKMMIEKDVVIYENVKDLPEPIEKFTCPKI